MLLSNIAAAPFNPSNTYDVKRRMPLWTDICYCLFCCASRENLPNSGFKHIIGKTCCLDSSSGCSNTAVTGIEKVEHMFCRAIVPCSHDCVPLNEGMPFIRDSYPMAQDILCYRSWNQAPVGVHHGQRKILEHGHSLLPTEADG